MIKLETSRLELIPCDQPLLELLLQNGEKAMAQSINKKIAAGWPQKPPTP